MKKKLLGDLRKIERNVSDTAKPDEVFGFEVQGNNGGNYLKIGKYADGDNRLYIEIGDCCVITFMGTVTVEAFTSFLTNISMKDDQSLIDSIRSRMMWGDDVNERLFEGSKKMTYFDRPAFNDLFPR